MKASARTELLYKNGEARTFDLASFACHSRDRGSDSSCLAGCRAASSCQAGAFLRRAETSRDQWLLLHARARHAVNSFPGRDSRMCDILQDVWRQSGYYPSSSQRMPIGDRISYSNSTRFRPTLGIHERLWRIGILKWSWT